MSILKQCNIFPGNNDFPESSVISESLSSSQTQFSGPDEESCHSSILDSTHFSDDNARGLDIHTLTSISNPASTKRSSRSDCDVSPSKLRGWKVRRRTKSFLLPSENTDDSTNPLLNPNATHERRSLDMLTIDEEDCSNDQEKKTRRKMDGEYCCTATNADFDSSSATASSLHKVAFRAIPMVRVRGPPFTRHRRNCKSHTLDTTRGDKKGTSPPSGRPRKSPYSRIYARSRFIRYRKYMCMHIHNTLY